MKKLLVLMLIFGIASVANAGMKLSVNGQVAPDYIDLWTSDVITLDIIVETGTWFSGGNIGIKLSNAQGSLDASNATYETEPMTRYYVGNPMYTWWDGTAAWSVQFSVFDSSSTHVSFTGGNNVDPKVGNTLGEYVLVDGIIFHCEEATDVIIDLVCLSDLRYMTYTGAPPGVDDMVNIVDGEVTYTSGTIIDSIHVNQVPEPMTIVLLGLGGLFLRRRK